MSGRCEYDDMVRKQRVSTCMTCGCEMGPEQSTCPCCGRVNPGFIPPGGRPPLPEEECY